jgi:hypothetical protein
MPLSDLSPTELKILHHCMQVTANDPTLFPDWEFFTLFGLTRAEFITVLDRWPDLDESKLDTRLAIQNSLNNLLGYPHQHHDSWEQFFPFTKRELAIVFAKWRGRASDGYFDGMA